jgi:two-component system sensor histidine kinase KdpD
MDGLEGGRRVLLVIGTSGLLLGLSTLLVAILENVAGIPDASAAYLVAVIVTAAAFGTAAAIGAAVGSFVLYDFLFIDPRYTLTVSSPGEWLNLLLLLIMGIVVARLAGALRDRADAAGIREREAHALFQVSRALATRTDTTVALREIAMTLRRETGVLRAWLVLRVSPGVERTVADSDRSAKAGLPARQAVLRRGPGDAPAEWVRLHQPTGPGRAARGPEAAANGPDGYKVAIEAAGRELGAIWGLRPRGAGPPDRSATRLLSSAADQIGQVLEQDRLAAESRAAELARQSDALKSALLESVSHDLRTPLASIRIAAGTLLDPDVELSDEDRAASAQAIDREAEYLNRLVTNLLDLSRIEGGALRADSEASDTADLVARTLERMAPRLQARSLTVAVPHDLPPVLVDPVFFDQVLTNLIENEVKYVPSDRHILVNAEIEEAAEEGDEGALRLTVEDDGPGVPPDALEHLFEKFFRVRRRGETSRPGTGIGLAVVRGLTEAMGGSVSARPSDLGGLAVDVRLPFAPAPGVEAGEPPGPAQPVATFGSAALVEPT